VIIQQELQWLKQHSTKENTSRLKSTPDAEKEINKSTNMERSTLWRRDMFTEES